MLFVYGVGCSRLLLHHRTLKALTDIDFRHFEVQNEEKCHHDQHSMEDSCKNRIGKHTPQQVHHGENDRNGSHRKTAVKFVAACLHLLALRFQHIKKARRIRAHRLYRQTQTSPKAPSTPMQ